MAQDTRQPACRDATVERHLPAADAPHAGMRQQHHRALVIFGVTSAETLAYKARLA